MARWIAALSLVFLAGGATVLAQSRTVSWQIVTSNTGARVGYVRETATISGTRREIRQLRDYFLREEGMRPQRATEETVLVVDASGMTVETISTQDRRVARTRMRAEGGVARVTREAGGHTTTHSIALPPGTRFDLGNGLLKTWDRASRLQFKAFSMGMASVQRGTIEATGTDADGNTRALRTLYEGDELRSVTTLLIDRKDDIVETRQAMLGAVMVTRPATEAEALAPFPPYSMIRGSMIKAPYRISTSAKAGHIRYRFGFRDGLWFAPPATGEQRGTLDGNGLTLDICPSCGPATTLDAEQRAAALRATTWMQSDHRRLRALAAPVAAMKMTDRAKMTKLSEIARSYLKRFDYAGHFSALESLERRAGDCTEDAVLLAALGRAAGIPTKVASGIVYSREAYHGVSNAFLPHSWTLAWIDGRWQTIDMSLGGFDATHVALTIGDGDRQSIAAAGQLASLLVWREMGEIRTR